MPRPSKEQQLAAADDAFLHGEIEQHDYDVARYAAEGHNITVDDLHAAHDLWINGEISDEDLRIIEALASDSASQ